MSEIFFARLLFTAWQVFQMASCQQCSRVSFIPSVLRDCVSDAWQQRYNWSDHGTCAMKCAQLARCRAFTMDGGCRLFVFDACSRGLLRSASTCNNRSSLIYVRQVSGVPAGRVCPSRFAFRGDVGSFNGSLYSRISEPANWMDASAQCGSGGFSGGVPSKLAELDDGIGEVADIERATGLTTADQYWVAATKLSGSWQWAMCGAPIPTASSSGMWSHGEPNSLPHGADKARIKDGQLADIVNNSLFLASCECLDPFLQF